ncbi:MAG: hypothetical protein AB8H79_07135 [Myxococcota bacterium]
MAGTVAIAVTLAIERFGGRIGGLIGTLPTTIVPAALGLWGDDPVVFGETMGAVPAGMLLNAGFLWLWRVVPPRLPQKAGLGARLAMMTLASLTSWTAAAIGLVLALGWTRHMGIATLWLGLGTLIVLAIAGLAATRTARPAPAGKRRVRWPTLLMRGALAGGAIAAAIVLKDVGGPVASGVASVFPAIFLTAMVGLWISQGEAVPSGAVGPMMLGSTAVGGFALLAAFTFPAFGRWGGTAIAWPIAVLLTTLPAYAWLRRNPPP